MAKANVTCRCEICGNTFEHVHTCYNRRDADSYEKWAAENITVCPACYAASKKAAANSKVDAYIAENFVGDHPLPEITGASEKQIAYAASLRSKFIGELAKYGAKISNVFAAEDEVQLSKLDEAGLAEAQEQAAAEGLTVEAWFERHREEMVSYVAGLNTETMMKIRLILAEANASKLIDALR
nr:MAG TPA: hypothetical protein [Caudoviricetes sp.]